MLLTWFAFSTVAIVAGAERGTWGAEASPLETAPATAPTEAVEADGPETVAWSCGRTTASGTFLSERGELIPVSPETIVRLTHKLDVDASEDRCIVEVSLSHQPDRGCAYDLVFTATRRSSSLLLTEMHLSADSFCPGWLDDRETGDPNDVNSFKYISRPELELSLSTMEVPDSVADESCTTLQGAVAGSVRLQQMSGSRPTSNNERFDLSSVQFSGEYLSRGDVASTCPVTTEEDDAVEEVAAPAESKRAVVAGESKRAVVAGLSHVGTAPIPLLPAVVGGVDLMVEFSPRYTATISSSWNTSGGLVSLDNRLTLGDPNKESVRAVAGLRLGSVRGGETEDLPREAVGMAGLLVGVETSRARSSPFYATADLSAFYLTEQFGVRTSYIEDLEGAPGAFTATVRLGTFLGPRS